jgi:hypothetical protein
VFEGGGGGGESHEREVEVRWSAYNNEQLF